VSSSTLRRPAPQQMWPLGRAPAPAGTLLLDKISAPATNAYSCLRKLRTAYGGYAFRVRRDDSAEQDIGFAGDYVDTAALLTFCGAGSGYVVTLYDQSGNGRDVTQATTTAQPRIVNAGALEQYPSGRAAMSFDGTNDTLRRSTAGATSISGNPNVTVGSAFQWLDATSFAWEFGATGSTQNNHFGLYRAAVGATPIFKNHYGTGRNFEPVVNPDTAARSYVVQHTAGATTHTGVIRQDGVSLAQGATGGTAVALNVLDQNLQLGGAAYVPTGFFQGKLNCFVLFNAVLAGTDLATLEAELALHTTAPPTYVLDQISVPALCAYSCYRKLRNAYGGYAFRVRKSSGGEQDIGFVGNLVDTAALVTFCAGGDGFVTVLYDQSGNGRNPAQPGAQYQPKVVAAGALIPINPGRPAAMSFPSGRLTDGQGGELVSGGIGLSGSPDISVGATFKASVSWVGSAWTVGSNSGAGTRLSQHFDSVNTTYKEHNGGGIRFGLPIAASEPASYVMQHAAGGGVQSGTLRQNGVDCGATVYGSAGPLNLGNTNMSLGSLLNSNATGVTMNVFMVFNAVLSGADLTALEIELAAHV
jgi:hypothetical protein